jgi:hypothetical protein
MPNFTSILEKQLFCQRWATWRLSTFDLYPGGGGGAWGAGTNMWHPETPASYKLLPAPLAPQIPTLWIHTSGGWGGGALILDRCRAFDLFASVDAHLCFCLPSKSGEKFYFANFVFCKFFLCFVLVLLVWIINLALLYIQYTELWTLRIESGTCHYSTPQNFQISFRFIEITISVNFFWSINCWNSYFRENSTRTYHANSTLSSGSASRPQSSSAANSWRGWRLTWRGAMLMLFLNLKMTRGRPIVS